MTSTEGARGLVVGNLVIVHRERPATKIPLFYMSMPRNRSGRFPIALTQKGVILFGGFVLMFSSLLSSSPVFSAPSGKAKEVLVAAGFTDSEIASLADGKLVKRVLDTTHEREIAMAFAVLVEETPENLRDHFVSLRLKKEVDPEVTDYHIISERGEMKDFDKLVMDPYGDATAEEIINVSPGDEINFSREEMALFGKLKDGTGKAKDRVEKTLREVLFHRCESYKEKGLDGILPYVRPDGDYMPGKHMAIAPKMIEILQKVAPNFYKHLANFPANRPDDLYENYSWATYDSEGKLNVDLLHRMGREENGSFLFSERVYYALNGYNSYHGEGGAIRTDDGTLLVFASRASTDAVTGFGSSFKRAAGVRMMGNTVAQMVETIMEAKKREGEL